MDYENMNLYQKIVAARKMIPPIIKKQHSEDVEYEFSTIDDINEFFNPALNEVGLFVRFIDGTATRKEENFPLYFWPKNGGGWHYEADAKVIWLNADNLEE